jgi:hypothetical protein
MLGRLAGPKSQAGGSQTNGREEVGTAIVAIKAGQVQILIMIQRPKWWNSPLLFWVGSFQRALL